VFASLNSNRTMVEMVALANEMAQRITGDTREWTALIAGATLTGDGLTTAFPLPPDYRRMLLTSQVWRSSSTQQPMRFVVNPDQWARRRAAAESDSRGEWTIYGRRIHIEPVMAAGTTARFMYLSKNCVVLTGGDPSTVFIEDNDSFVLDERLLKLGMIFQWKMNKGAPYAEDMGTYADALMNAMGPDRPAPIMIDRTAISADARIAYPGEITGPDWPLS